MNGITVNIQYMVLILLSAHTACIIQGTITVVVYQSQYVHMLLQSEVVGCLQGQSLDSHF